MKEDEIDPVEPSLGALFSAERARDRAPAGTRERVLERVMRSVDPGGGGGSDPGPSSGGLARALPILAALAAGGVVGGAVVAVVRPPRVVYVDRIVPVAPSAAPEPNDDVRDDVRDVKEAPTNVPANVDSGAPPPLASSSSRRDALAEERAILDVARTALGRNDGAHALEATDRHARLYPRGQMAEEREAIAVQALVKLGRTDDAAARGARFRARYPNSVLMGVIDAALGGK